MLFENLGTCLANPKRSGRPVGRGLPWSSTDEASGEPGGSPLKAEGGNGSEKAEGLCLRATSRGREVTRGVVVTPPLQQGPESSWP